MITHHRDGSIITDWSQARIRCALYAEEECLDGCTFGFCGPCLREPISTVWRPSLGTIIAGLAVIALLIFAGWALGFYAMHVIGWVPLS